MEKLEAIVTAIESGQIELEESIEKYAEGMALIKHCRAILAEAEQKVQKLQASTEGELRSGPFTVED